jgi:hypothetical protein
VRGPKEYGAAELVVARRWLGDYGADFEPIPKSDVLLVAAEPTYQT